MLFRSAGYADNGNALWTQDPNHGSYTAGDPTQYRSEFYYDSYGRLGRSSTPKSSLFAPGLLNWSDTVYDANDNTTATISAHYGLADAGIGPQATTTYDALDRSTQETGPRVAADGGPTTTQTDYDSAGRVIRVTRPKGVITGSVANDYATETAYDLLDRTSQTTAYGVDASGNVDPTQTRKTHYCYDLAGDLRSVTGPKGDVSFTSCPAVVLPASYTYTSASYTTKYEYDAAHRQTKATDPLGKVTQAAYDQNGQVTSATDKNGNTTTTTYDDRGMKVTEVAPFDTSATPARTLTTKYEYDPLGDLKRLISPQAYDAAGGGSTYTDYVESYSYDALKRLVTTTQPAGLPPDNYRQTVLSNGATAYWRLDEPSGTFAGDSGVGVSAHGTYSASGVTLNQTGALTSNLDKAASFSGAGSVTSTDAPVKLQATSFSIEAWFKTSSAAASQTILASSTLGYTLKIATGKVSFTFCSNASCSTTAGGSTSLTYNDGAWHHVIAVFDNTGDSMKTYLDGTQVWSTTTTANVSYGAAGDTIGTGFNGSLDEVAYYAKALTSTHVTANYNAGKATTTPPAQTYLQKAYDKNGNTTMVSLPTLQSSPANVTPGESTSSDYLDGGQIHSSSDPATPKVRFDYTAEGWQAQRVPETAVGSGSLDYGHGMYWAYHPDGLLKDLRDLGGQRELHSYDADGNQLTATEASGSPLTITSSWDGFDQLATVKVPHTGTSNFRQTEFGYDLHGNTTQLVQNKIVDPGGAQVTPGRVETYTYDTGDQPLIQVDDSGTTATTDDERITNTWSNAGWELTRLLEKANGASWTAEQNVTHSYYDNGQLKSLTTTDGDPNTTIEQHTLSYIVAGVYQNGNRAQDTFLLKEIGRAHV